MLCFVSKHEVLWKEFLNINKSCQIFVHNQVNLVQIRPNKQVKRADTGLEMP